MMCFQHVGEIKVSFEYFQYLASFASESLFLHLSHILPLSLSAGVSEKISNNAFEAPVKTSLVQTWFAFY